MIESYFLDLETLAAGDAVTRVEESPLGPGWLCFRNPEKVLEARSLAEVEGILNEAANHGHAFGFLTYEAGKAFDAQFPIRDRPTILAWFALYPAPPQFYKELSPNYEPVAVKTYEPDFDEITYGEAFAAVQRELKAGNTYQVNLTFRLRFRSSHTAPALFAACCGVEPPPYATFFHGGDWQIASFSPELFFEKQGQAIRTKPMKGTAPVPPRREDLATTVAHLQSDPKSRAENLMIADMVRNDLSRIALPNSVRATQLMEVTPHRTVIQATSTIEAQTDAEVNEIFRALFPPASMTGAPKLSTAQIIAHLERTPRGLYSGAIGYFTPDETRWSVAIRTAWIENGEGIYGVGGGIVADSNVEAEYQECQLKAQALQVAAPQWQLIEAIPSGDLPLAKDNPHLLRLIGSADTFGIPLDLYSIPPATGDPSLPKARLAVQRDGKMSLKLQSSDLPERTLKAALANTPVQSQDPNLQHKTNSRAVYNRHLAQFPNYDEVLLYNEKGEITEFCRGNVILAIDGQLVTPTQESGCLPGIGVRNIPNLTYRAVSLDDLDRAENIWFVNAITGLRPVKLIRRTP